MNKESTEQAAREFIDNAKDELGNAIDGLLDDGAEPNCLRKVMASFAHQRVQERERQIADELDGINDPYDAGMHISIALQQFIKQLRGEGE